MMKEDKQVIGAWVDEVFNRRRNVWRFRCGKSLRIRRLLKVAPCRTDLLPKMPLFAMIGRNNSSCNMLSTSLHMLSRCSSVTVRG